MRWIVSMWIVLLTTAGLLIANGCARHRVPGIENQFAPPAHDRDAESDPVVVIPGMQESRLIDSETGRVVWDPTDGTGRDEGSAVRWAYRMREGVPLQLIGNDLLPSSAGRRLEKASGARDRRRAYRNIVAVLEAGGYRLQPDHGARGADGPPPADGFQFDYDWRRDVADNAAQLHRFLLEKREAVMAARPGRAIDEIRFDVVAHSTGGLILRYYLRYGDADLAGDGALPPISWAGAQLVDRAILVGTPNAGAVQALNGLARDGGTGGYLSPSSPIILGTLPAAYQILPRGRHGGLMRLFAGDYQRIDDIFDPALWELLGWGLASPDRARLLERLLPDISDSVERRRIAIDHLRKCLRRARRIAEALDVPGSPPPGLGIHLLLGVAVATDAVAAVDWATGDLEIIARRSGDGTVLRSSALLDERTGGEWSPALLSPVEWSSVMLFHAGSDGLTADPAFAENLLFLLLEQSH